MDGTAPDTRWWTSPRRLVRRLLSLDDSPHAIALGTAIGMFVGMTPTVGIQMILIVTIAAVTRPLFHFNRVAGLITVYISNPITIMPLYAAFYYTGTLVVEAPMTPAEFQEQFELALDRSWLDPLRFIFQEVAWPMIAGSLLIAIATSMPTYPIVRRLVVARRRLASADEPTDATADTPLPTAPTPAQPSPDSRP
ncbi:MAG TPA: hypothetical protein DIC23_10825 [Planctomycetaceae bacterium]|nr:hypothetical protein [Planctomycetaceae bacterium]